VLKDCTQDANYVYSRTHIFHSSRSKPNHQICTLISNNRRCVIITQHPLSPRLTAEHRKPRRIQPRRNHPISTLRRLNLLRRRLTRHIDNDTGVLRTRRQNRSTLLSQRQSCPLHSLSTGVGQTTYLPPNLPGALRALAQELGIDILAVRRAARTPDAGAAGYCSPPQLLGRRRHAV
jgi:hypothetical protein